MQMSKFDKALQQLSESILSDKELGHNRRHKRSDDPGPSRQREQNPKIRELLSALAITKWRYNPDHIEVAKVLNSLALNYSKLEDYQKAKEYLEKALAIEEKFYGSGHKEVAKTLANLNKIHATMEASQKQKQLSSSQEQRQEVRKTGEDTGLVNSRVEELLEVLTTKERLYGPDHIEVAETLNRLAVNYSKLEDYQKAKECLEKALAIEEKFYGSGHKEVAKTSANLNKIHAALEASQKQKQLSFSQEQRQEVRKTGEDTDLLNSKIKELLSTLAITKWRYNPDHIEVAEILNSLAVNYFKLGDYQKAKEYLEKTLTINESHYGPDHIEVAKVLNSLALSCFKLEDYQKAKESLEKTLAIEEKVYGPGHIEVTKTLERLSKIYIALGASQKQKQLSSSQEQRQEVRKEDTGLVNPKIKELLEVLATKESSYGSDHLQTAMTLKDLADAYGELKDYQKQREFLEKALPILERDFGLTNPIVARMLTNLGNAYSALGNMQKAHELHTKASGVSEQYKQIALGVRNLKFKERENPAYASLFVAAKKGNLSLVKHLIEEKGTDVNEKDKYGYTSLHFAAEERQSDIVEYLVSKGADVNAVNEDRNTPLHLAIQYTGANDKDHNDITLRRAYHELLMAVSLIKGGADVEIENKAGETPLQRIVMNDRVSVMKYLVEHGNIVLLRGTDKGRNFWQYVLVNKDQTETFFAQEDINSIELTNRGKILHSGWGQDPPENAIEELIKLLPNRLSKGPSWLVQRNELLEALVRKERRYGSDHIEVAKTLYHLSNAYFNLEDYKKAKESYERALPIFEKHYGSDHVTAAKILHELGNTYFYLEDYQKAKELLERALPTLEKHCPSCVTVAKALHDLGNAYYKLPDNQKAGELYEKALAIKQKHYDSNHVEVVKTLGNLGSVAHASENYQKAKKIFERVLPHTEKHFGSEHFKVGEILYNLGNTYYGLKDYQKAKEFYDRALVIRERHYGSDHIEVAKTLNHLGDTYNELEDYQKAKESYERALSVLEKHYSSDHIGAAVILNNLGLVYDKLEDYQKAKESYERASLIERKHYGSDHVEVEECLPSTSSGSRGRRKREAKECELSWEDVDGFNEEKEESRDLSKVRINSDEFIDYIKSTPMSEAKLTQLVQLADKVQVTGKSQGPVNKLISNQKVINHLSRAGRVSSIAMHGMMAKATLGAFLNGDGEGVAINLGFVAGGQGFAKVAEAASIKGTGLIADGKLLLGRSLKAASPFLARGTSAFVAYDLVNQIKEYKKGNKDALAGIVGDSIYLGVDAAEIGIEVAEAFEVLEGVSSVTGPIGAAIGAVVFVGTDVYLAVRRVDKIDEIIHLTTKERFIEGLRAFIGMNLEGYIEELMQEKEVNNQLVTQGLEYLKQHSDIQRYVFPTGKTVIDSCRTIQSIERCPPTGLNICYDDGSGNLFTIKKREKCTTKLQTDLDNKVLLDKKRTDIKWSRARPSDSGAGEFLCLPQGNDESVPSNGTYLCENAIGIEYANNRTENNTLISLGNGDDVVVGFPYGNHIVVLGDGHKNITLGDGDDTLLLEGSNIKGAIYGGNGTNTLDLEHFAQKEKSVRVGLSKVFGYMYYEKGDEVSDILGIHGINDVLLRRNKQDHIHTACDTRYVDGRGGEDNNNTDNIIIPHNSNCSYEIKLVVRPYTNINNYAINGNFTYIVPMTSSGEASINLITHTSPQSDHRFVFSYTLYDINDIEKINNTVSFSFIQNVGNLRFAPNPINTDDTRYTTDYEFSITNNAANNASYKLSDNTEIKVGERNIYAIQSTNKSVDEIVSDYPTIANNLKMSIFVQSLLSNETVAIGHGNHDVLHNDPYYKSHLVGNGGENIFVVTSGDEVLDNNKLPIPEVVIYDLDKENLIDTLDLRQIKQQIVKDLGKEVKAKTKTLINNKDLLIELLCFRENQVEESVVRVRLKDALLTNWYERLHVIVDNVPMKIEEFELKPLPLIFDESNKNIIVIGSQDIEEENKVVVSKEIGNYTFVRSGNNLIITNAFDRNLTSNEFCTISLGEFYQEAKMQTLDIKFADKEIILKDHQEQISSARDIDVVKKEHKDQVYDDVFNHTRSESSEVNETTIHEIRHRDEYLNVTEHQRSRRAINEKEIPITSSKVSANDDLEFFVAQNNATFVMGNNGISSAATRIGSGINDLFGWVKSSIGGLFNSRAALPENNTTQSSLSQVDAQVSVDGTIMLLDLLIRKVTDQKHIPLAGESVSLLEAQGYASSITLGFDTLLKRTARGCGIQDPNFNPIPVQSTIVGQIRNGKFSEISKTLYSSAKEACPKFKQTDKFLNCLSGNLEKILAEKEALLLFKKQNNLQDNVSLSKIPEKAPARLSKENEPHALLNGMSISKGIGNVLGL